MEQVVEEYFELGHLPQKVLSAIEMNDFPVMIKRSVLEMFENSPKGKEMGEMDIDACYGGSDARFEFMVEDPHQVRDGGQGAILLVQSFDGFFDQGNVVDRFCFALRIKVSKDDKCNDIYEIQDIDLHYNLKRNDEVLWKGNIN